MSNESLKGLNDAERLDDALSKMKHGTSLWRENGKLVETESEASIRELVDRSFPTDAVFFNVVDWIKGYLQPTEKLAKVQSATRLRVMLEGKIPEHEYLGKPHLAVALVEMGYKVEYDDHAYFKTDYRCRTAMKEMGAKFFGGMATF